MSCIPALASARAHELLAELIRLGVHLTEPITVSARSEADRLQVVVQLTPFEGKAQLHLNMRGYEQLGIAPPAPVVAAPPDDLSELDRIILSLASAEPTPVKTLQRRAKYESYSYFCAAVRRLVARGLLKRTVRGVHLPAA